MQGRTRSKRRIIKWRASGRHFDAASARDKSSSVKSTDAPEHTRQIAEGDGTESS
jgi:hypothetical protein